MSDLEKARVASAEAMRKAAQSFTVEQYGHWSGMFPAQFVALINAMGTVTSETIDELVEKLKDWASGSGARWYQEELTPAQRELVTEAIEIDAKRVGLVDRRRLRVNGAMGALDIGTGALVTVVGYLTGIVGAIFVPLALAVLGMLIGGILGARGAMRLSSEEEIAHSRRMLPQVVGGWILLGGDGDLPRRRRRALGGPRDDRHHPDPDYVGSDATLSAAAVCSA